jgi:CelD/BcsL family acetyltransferase involved in cellulose biosynthesis
LLAYRFDHLLVSQAPLAAHAWRQTDSSYIDLSGGYEAFVQERTAAGSRLVTETLRKMRKAERELGPLRLVPFSDDRDVFDAMLRWKREQYRRIGSIDHLAEAWKIAVLERIWRTRSEHFSGMLSALYIGDRLAAAHLGMCSRGVLHCWFPAFPHDDPQLAKYSPGTALWLMLAQRAGQLGLRRFDMGKGDESYKRRLMNGSTPIAEGAVDRRIVSGTLLRGWHGMRELVRRSPLKRPAQGVLRRFRAWKGG